MRLECGNEAPVAGAARADLQKEIARLRELCARSDEVASRHSVMLREADHRIKNSLQIVAGLVQAQARREESASARMALGVAAARIQSIARIHDALQISEGVDTVEIGAILKTMCQTLHAMAGDARSVAVLVDVEVIRAPVAIAQPIVLAINELVVNALRHAFPDDTAGTIHINVAQVDDELRIVVADDGQGLPAGYAEGHGYGMRLVRMMADQVGGALRVEAASGAKFTLSVPVRAYQGGAVAPMKSHSAVSAPPSVRAT